MNRYDSKACQGVKRAVCSCAGMTRVTAIIKLVKNQYIGTIRTNRLMAKRRALPGRPNCASVVCIMMKPLMTKNRSTPPVPNGKACTARERSRVELPRLPCQMPNANHQRGDRTHHLHRLEPQRWTAVRTAQRAHATGRGNRNCCRHDTLSRKPGTRRRNLQSTRAPAVARL